MTAEIPMPRIILIVLLSSILMLACSGSRQQNFTDLSSPEVCIESHYLALKSSNIELLKRVHVDDRWIKNDQIKKIASSIVSYGILEKLEMKKDEFAQEGEIYIRVEEKLVNGKTNFVNFALRNVDGRWLIVSFNADEEEPIDPELIEKIAR